MGKITGFMDYGRVEEGYKPVTERLKNYKEFVIGLDDAQANKQAARCMDCCTPDLQMEKVHIDRRVGHMQDEGAIFRTGMMVGKLPKDSKVTNWAKETIAPEQLQKDFDAIILTGGAEQSRDLPVPGRELDGVHFAMEFLPQQNRIDAGDKVKGQIRADGKHVIVIGGGDTGSDCVGTSNRHGAKGVTQ